MTSLLDHRPAARASPVRAGWPHALATAFAAALALALVLAPGAAARAADGAPAKPATPATIATPATPTTAISTSASTATPSPPASRRLLVMLRAPAPHARLDGGYGGGYGDAVRRKTLSRIAERIASEHGLGVVTQWAMPVLGMDCVVMTLPDGVALDDAIRAVEGHDEVAWAQPMNEFTAQGQVPGPTTGGAAHVHGDPLYPMQPVAALWRLDALHEVATGRHVRVAIIDSGVDADHPDLAQQLDARENFVDGQSYRAEQHGTAVAGLVAARADNGIGIVGVAPDARLVSLRACWQTGSEAGSRTVCDSLSLAKALHHAIEHPTEIINMSLSGPPDPLIGRLIDAALARRQQVVAAIDPSAPGGGFPARHPGVVAVRDAATAPRAGDPADAWCAPARDLPATVPGGGWRLVTGTSFAAAQVSGLLAVLEQARTEGGVAGTPAPASARLVRAGDGGIDACASLVAMTSRPGTNASARVEAGAGGHAVALACTAPVTRTATTSTMTGLAAR